MSTNGNGSSPDRAPAILLGASFEQVPVAVATHSDEALECVAITARLYITLRGMEEP